MKRVIEAFHVKRTSERAVGLIQIILVVLVVVGTIGITRLIRTSGGAAPDMSASLEQVVVDTVSPKRISHTITRTVTGTVEARALVSITPQVSGRVESISPSMAPGKVVRAGEAYSPSTAPTLSWRWNRPKRKSQARKQNCCKRARRPRTSSRTGSAYSRTSPPPPLSPRNHR